MRSFLLCPSAILCTTVLLPSHALAAQSRPSAFPARPAPVIAPVDTGDTLAARLATITTDTGAFAPGHRDFSRYDTPGLCRAAARVTRASFQLSLEEQANGDTLSADTIGVGGTAPVARACGAHVTLAGATTRELGDLFNLALHEQNDTLAQAVLTKLAAQDATPGARDSTWLFGMRSYLFFGRLAAAEVLMAQVDARGTAAQALQLMLHHRLGNYFNGNGDTVRFRRELERVLALGEQVPDKKFSYGYAWTAYVNLMRLAALEHPDSMPAVAQRAQRDLRRYSDNDQGTTQFNKSINWGGLPLDSVIDKLAPEWYTYRRHSGGIPAPRLQADYWFPAPGRPSNDTIRPVRGKINLICHGGSTTDFWQDVFNSKPLYSGYQQAAHIRRWLAQYGAAGLEVTIVRSVPGYERFDYQDLNTLRWFQTPTEEAQLWRWYAQEYEQLPVTVAVQVKKTDAWLPPPDGRRYQTDSIQFNQYFQGLHNEYGPLVGEEPGACTVIGRDGVVLYSRPGQGGGNDVGVVLKWLFQGPGAAVASSPGAPTSVVPGTSPTASSDSSLHPLHRNSRGNSQ